MENNFTYDYFISYRRACGGALEARHVKSILCKYGKKVFLDVDDIKAGEYEPQIFNAIDNSKDFILILNEESWREKEKKDVYYEEIIRITQQSGNIIPIEFAKDVLCKMPDGESCVWHNQLKRNIKKFEKVSYSHDAHFKFEEKLCDKLGIEFILDSQIKKLPHFSMPFEIDEDDLVKRDEKVKALSDEIISHHIFNLVGIGGCGKTTLTYLLADKYKNLFDNIAYVVVNGNIKEDFASQINATLKLDFAQNVRTDDKYNTIISFMDQYETGNNLLILDINETVEKTAIDDYAKKLKNNNLPTNKIYPKGWNILILSRERCGDFHNKILSDDVDKVFLKELFLSKAGDNYNDFENFGVLFELIKFSPLLAEHLGIFLYTRPKKNIEEIKRVLGADTFKNGQRIGINAQNRSDQDQQTIIYFLKNLIKYDIDFSENEKELLRHFILWKSDYIQYEIIDDLIDFDSDDNLENALSNLSRRSILNFDRTKSAYKLHGLLADSIREQIDIEKQDYSMYTKNIERILAYNSDDIQPYLDFAVINSLCEYDITDDYVLLNKVNKRSHFVFMSNHNYKFVLYKKCVQLLQSKIENNFNNIEYKAKLIEIYNNFAMDQKDYCDNYDLATIYAEKAIEIASKLVKDDPKQFLLKWIIVKHNLAVLLLFNNKLENANVIWDEINSYDEICFAERPKQNMIRRIVNNRMAVPIILD